MKAGKTKQRHQTADHGHLLQASLVGHGDEAVAAPAPAPTKGCAAFLVGEDAEVQQRFAVPVAVLGHPRIMEMLEEAREEYGYAHVGPVVVPCSAERFQEAVDAAVREHGARRHRRFFGLPHLVGFFRPSQHVVAQDRWRRTAFFLQFLHDFLA